MHRRTLLSGMAAVSTVAIVGTVAAQLAKSAQHPTLHTVEITNFQFSPATLHVRAGDRIKWTNLDIVPHTATALDSSWHTGELKPNESAERTVEANQTEQYCCLFHPSMKATLVLS